MKLTLQMEAEPGLVVRQSMVVEVRVDDLQCPDCKKSFTRHTWESSVQIRQRTEHRRTLLRLEQLILQHKAHKQLIGLAHTKEGIDFFFERHRDSQAFVAFVKAWAVARHHDSKHLVSHNANNSTYRFKKTTCIELCPVCRDDLVFLPRKAALAMGGMPPLMLCNRATCVIGLVDPAGMRALELSAVEYWKRPFYAVCRQSQLTEFVVLDVVLDDATAARGGSDGAATSVGSRGRVRACDVEVARATDFGQNDERTTVRSHLGTLLHPGDVALGYDLRSLNMGIDEEELGGAPPLEVYLVRKKREDRREKGGRKGHSVVVSDICGDADVEVADGEDEGLEAAAEQLLGSLGSVDHRAADNPTAAGACEGSAHAEAEVGPGGNTDGVGACAEAGGEEDGGSSGGLPREASIVAVGEDVVPHVSNAFPAREADDSACDSSVDPLARRVAHGSETRESSTANADVRVSFHEVAAGRGGTPHADAGISTSGGGRRRAQYRGSKGRLREREGSPPDEVG